MILCDGKVSRVPPHILILGQRELDRLGAVLVAALAKELSLLWGGVSLAHVLDALVDLAEERLVPCDALLPRPHGAILDTTTR